MVRTQPLAPGVTPFLGTGADKYVFVFYQNRRYKLPTDKKLWKNKRRKKDL